MLSLKPLGMVSSASTSSRRRNNKLPEPEILMTPATKGTYLNKLHYPVNKDIRAEGGSATLQGAAHKEHPPEDTSYLGEQPAEFRLAESQGHGSRARVTP